MIIKQSKHDLDEAKLFQNFHGKNAAKKFQSKTQYCSVITLFFKLNLKLICDPELKVVHINGYFRTLEQ